MGSRKGISLFRRSEAPDLERTDMMSLPEFPTDFERPANANTGDLLAGQEIKVLYRQSADEDGFSLVHAWFKPHYCLPRHSHDADCLYYVVAGEAHLGSQVLVAGDGFFVPAGAPYQYSAGPGGVEVLEFRHARSFDMKITETTDRYAAIFDTAAQWAPLWRNLEKPPSVSN